MHIVQWRNVFHYPFLCPEHTLLFFPMAELEMVRFPTGNLRGKEGGFHLSVIAFHTFAEGHEVADGLGFGGYIGHEYPLGHLSSFRSVSQSPPVSEIAQISSPFLTIPLFPRQKHDAEP